MDLAAVMQQVADQLDTIGGGLTVFGYPPYRISPPAAVVTYPDAYSYDSTYSRGMDEITLPVHLLVGKVDDARTRDELVKYAAGAGASSVKAVVESGAYTAFDTVRVTDVEFDIASFGGDEYLDAIFNLHIVGDGAP